MAKIKLPDKLKIKATPELVLYAYSEGLKDGNSAGLRDGAKRERRAFWRYLKVWRNSEERLNTLVSLDLIRVWLTSRAAKEKK